LAYGPVDVDRPIAPTAATGLCRHGNGHHVESVPKPADGGHAEPGAVELLAEPGDVNVNGLRFTNEAGTPCRGQDSIATQRTTPIFGHDAEELVLSRGQFQFIAI